MYRKHPVAPNASATPLFEEGIFNSPLARGVPEGGGVFVTIKNAIFILTLLRMTILLKDNFSKAENLLVMFFLQVDYKVLRLDDRVE